MEGDETTPQQSNEIDIWQRKQQQNRVAENQRQESMRQQAEIFRLLDRP